MCICDSKKTKTVPESMRGRTGGSLLPLLFFFLSPPFFLLALSLVSLIFLPPSPFSVPPPVSLHPFPLIYVVMIAVNTIHTFVLLRDGNLIFWWPSVIHVWSSKNVEKLVTPLKFYWGYWLGSCEFLSLNSTGTCFNIKHFIHY